MKARGFILILMIAGLSVLGWRDHRKLAGLREERDQLGARAQELGIPAGASHATKRPRPDPVSTSRHAARDFIRQHKQREEILQAGGNPEASAETSARAFDWMATLNAAQIRVVIGEILDDPDLDDLSRRRLVGRAVGFLSKNDPAGALALFNEFSRHLKDTGIGRETASDSLGALAEENPHAAIAWVRKHADEYPEIINRAHFALIRNTTHQDPALAFEIIREFAPQRNSGDAEASILSAARPEMRTTAFAAFLDHLATISDDERWRIEQRAWAGLARGIVGDGFEAGTGWLATANPDPDALSHILDRFGLALSNSRKDHETGQWVEWVAETLPAAESEKHILDMVRVWTISNHEAAGNWLVAAPEGPVRNLAIRGFAQTVFPHDPETTMLWIDTLPPGHDRTQTLNTIHHNWPKDDLEGAAAFAMEHGIE